ncbi:hypothetical protein XH83_22455 [Bradyrhizobium sp. CCBAU 53351]|nr:hypothetical protein XH83_22455 [Bradyrhizobium sp. CCBAU 53351]
MNQLVLSGTATLVLSGTRSSCYRGPESSLRACFSVLSSPSNFTNQKSFGFLLTDQTTSRIRGDLQRGAVNPARRQKPCQFFAGPNAHRTPFQNPGVVA